MTTSGKILTGFMVGATTGAILGLLFAPKKGEKTRSQIAYKTKKIADGINQGFVRAKKALSLGEKSNRESVVY